MIHKISNKDLIANRNIKLYSDDEKKYIDLISINDAIIEPIGSFTYKIQKYPSDIDINQIIKIKNNDFKTIVNDLKKTAIDIMKAKNVFFSDFKAGVDVRYPDDRDKYILRWSLSEIILGRKTLPGNKIIKLEDVLQMKSILKLDIIVFTDSRFIEASTFFILGKDNDDGTTEFINIPSDFFDRFTEELKKEVLKYTQPETFKLFKSVKRMWSLARVNKDFGMLKKLEPLINSNLSLLGQINADLETLELLFDKAKIIPINGMISTINSIGKRLSTIADIKLDTDILADLLSNFKESIKKYDGNSDEIKKILEEMHDYLLNVINSETSKYMKNHKLLPINKKYLPSKDEKTIGNGLIFDEGHTERIRLTRGGFVGNLMKKAYKSIANEYRKKNCNGKARPLELGEFHPLCANYEGPGTRVDLYPNTEPFNNVDNCARDHDFEYINIKNEKDPQKRALMIQESDAKAINCFKNFSNEEPYSTLGRLGLTGKLSVDKLLSAIQGKPIALYGGK